jgi:membrane associated rhomboid family serine protease
MGGLIPLGDASRRPRQFPFITMLLIVVNALVFFMELSGGDAFVNTWSAVPRQIVHGHHWITLFTSMFMHASWMHIIGNMVFLWAFGPEIEDAMGRGRYLVFYLAGGMVAMMAQVLSSPYSKIPSLGASGAIAAVMGAFIVTYPRDRIRTLLFFFIFFKVTYIPAVLLIGFWFLTQVLNFGVVAQVQSGGVAYLAHIGGFLFGAITARLIEDPQRIRYRSPYSP